MILGIHCSTTNKCKCFTQDCNQVHPEGTIIYEQIALMPIIPIPVTLFSILAHTYGIMELNNQS